MRASGLLYSGSFGRAHSWRGIPELAEAMAPYGCKIAFSVRGNAVEELRECVRESGADIIFPPFASAKRAERRLSAADVHIVSLREEWTGAVVPSKFFSALAIGRPVLFIGSPDSSIAHAIRELNVGWVLTSNNLLEIVAELALLAASPEKKEEIFRRCHAVYWEHFSRDTSLGRWDRALRSLVAD